MESKCERSIKRYNTDLFAFPFFSTVLTRPSYQISLFMPFFANDSYKYPLLDANVVSIFLLYDLSDTEGNHKGFIACLGNITLNNIGKWDEQEFEVLYFF
jgi:hypothetical protein